MPITRTPDQLPLYSLPAGRLSAGDTLYVDGVRYGVIDHITIPSTDKPSTVGSRELVMFVFKNEGSNAALDTPWSVVRFPYEMVQAVLADNLAAEKAAQDTTTVFPTVYPTPIPSATASVPPQTSSTPAPQTV